MLPLESCWHENAKWLFGAHFYQINYVANWMVCLIRDAQQWPDSAIGLIGTNIDQSPHRWYVLVTIFLQFSATKFADPNALVRY